MERIETLSDLIMVVQKNMEEIRIQHKAPEPEPEPEPEPKEPEKPEE